MVRIGTSYEKEQKKSVTTAVEGMLESELQCPPMSKRKKKKKKYFF
jgi:hypothetical protein